jgi:pimeloyl-ACP methyl ester carboxylesterase
MRGMIGLIIGALIWAGSSSGVAAEDVSHEYLGLTLGGNLEVAPGRSIKTDGVVLLVHDTLGHSRMEFMAGLQESLRDLGVSSLAITLSLGIESRQGMFNCTLEQDHRHEDAVDEIASWVQWLKEKGVNSITVAGHGRGANQVALYAINKLDRVVKRAVLISPMMQTPEKAAAQYQERFHRPLKNDLAAAEELSSNENGNQLVDVPGFLSCPNAKVTAGAFANYYGENPKYETTNLLQSIKLPVLMVEGSADPDLRDIEAARPNFEAFRNVTFVTVPDADHDFRDRQDELAKRMKEFLGQRVQG